MKYVYLLLVSGLLMLGSVVYAQKENSIIPPVIAVRVHPAPMTSTGALATTITQKTIQHRGATTLAQILQNAGGVQLQNMTGDPNQPLISMRGFGANASSNSLVLINGIPMTNPDLAPPNLGVIPLQDITTITIVPGSESVMYGDQAVGGIIDINIREADKQLPNLTCSAGSYDQHDCNVSAGNLYRDLAYRVHAGVNETDNYRDHNEYNQQLVSGQFALHRETGKTLFDYQLDNEYIEFPGALTASQVRQNRRQATNDTDFFRDSNNYFHLRHSRYFSDEWQLVTDMVRRQMSGHGVLFSPFTQGRVSYFVKPVLQGKWRTANVHAGADLQDDSYRLNSAFGPDNNKQQKFSLFSLLNAPLTQQTHFVMGARLAEQSSRINSTNENTFINRAYATTIGLTHDLSHSLQGYLRRAQSYRFPKADENASTATGITGLRTQRGTAYESGIQFNQKAYTGNISIYQLNLTDEIAFDPTQTVQQPFGSNQNLAPTTRRGMSVSGQYAPTEKVTFDAQCNLVRAVFQSGVNSNNRIPLVSEEILHAGIDYHFTDEWHVYTEALYTGNQYAANDNANVAGALGGYTLYNINLGYQHKNLNVSARINNIFSKDYYVYTVYQSNPASESFYPAPEMNFSLMVNYRFA